MELYKNGGNINVIKKSENFARSGCPEKEGGNFEIN